LVWHCSRCMNVT